MKVLPLSQQLLNPVHRSDRRWRGWKGGGGGLGEGCTACSSSTAEFRIFILFFYYREAEPGEWCNVNSIKCVLQITSVQTESVSFSVVCASPEVCVWGGGADLTRHRLSPRVQKLTRRASAKIKNEDRRGPWLTGWAGALVLRNVPQVPLMLIQEVVIKPQIMMIKIGGFTHVAATVWFSESKCLRGSKCESILLIYRSFLELERVFLSAASFIIHKLGGFKGKWIFFFLSLHRQVCGAPVPSCGKMYPQLLESFKWKTSFYMQGPSMIMAYIRWKRANLNNYNIIKTVEMFCSDMRWASPTMTLWPEGLINQWAVHLVLMYEWKLEKFCFDEGWVLLFAFTNCLIWQLNR